MGKLAFLFGSIDYISLGKKVLYISLISLFYSIIIASVLFVVGALSTTYNLINDVLSFVESYNASGASASNSSSLGVFFQLLSCLGVIDAFNASKLMLFSSISFLILRLLYLQIISATMLYVRLLTPLITK